VNDATVVVAKQVASSAPSPTGGTVTNGTYHLVDLTVYTGPGGAVGALPLAIKQTIAIHGGTADAISEVSGKSEDVTSTFAAAGTTITTAQTCPSAGSPQTGTFSATPTSVVFLLVNGAGQTVGYTYAP